jgi:hypothetical protein
MVLPPALAAFFESNATTILFGAVAGILILTILLLSALLRISRLNRLYARLTKGTSGGNLEERLLVYMGTVEEADRRMATLEREVADLRTGQQGCIQRVGMVRYDAFEEVGGEQSFAVVLLDEQQTGLALSSVYSRHDVRIYAKSLRNGDSSHPLTSEEQKALSTALAEPKRAGRLAEAR